MINTKRAGKIVCDPTIGLCERVCIEVPRVIDGCVSKFENQSTVLALTCIPPAAVTPFTFISATSISNASFINVSIVLLENGCSRITGEVVIDILVTFKDANNNIYTAKSKYEVNRDIILRLPLNPLLPYELKTAVNFYSIIGHFVTDCTISIQFCYIIVQKVIVMADILVPSYGDCVYPDCVSCNKNNICEEINNLPLFPI